MIRVAIVGYGNIGKAVEAAVAQSADMELACIVSGSLSTAAVPVIRQVEALENVDVAILCSPSRSVPEIAEKLLQKGISTVDSFDIHSGIVNLGERLAPVAKAHGAVAVIAAGWDPGTDSVVRALGEAMMPKGITYTNFGPGMSMGHTVAVKAVSGVKDALSMTIPLGTGIHRRMVYVELESGASLEDVSKAVKADPYFAHDETHVMQVESVAAHKDMGHGVQLTRKGVSGTADNQRIEFNMTINNPALTGQVMVSAARAATRQVPGCYTLIEIPPIHFLPGEKKDAIARLV